MKPEYVTRYSLSYDPHDPMWLVVTACVLCLIMILLFWPDDREP